MFRLTGAPFTDQSRSVQSTSLTPIILEEVVAFEQHFYLRDFPLLSLLYSS